jgi:hypothetical protein
VAVQPARPESNANPISWPALGTYSPTDLRLQWGNLVYARNDKHLAIRDKRTQSYLLPWAQRISHHTRLLKDVETV